MFHTRQVYITTLHACALPFCATRLPQTGAHIRLHPLRPDAAQGNLHHFSTKGLRTLVVAAREVPEAEFLEWEGRFRAANNDLAHGEALIDAVRPGGVGGIGRVCCALLLLVCLVISAVSLIDAVRATASARPKASFGYVLGELVFH